MLVSFQREDDASYVQIAGAVEDGAAVTQVAVDLDAPVDLILDFDVDGRLLGFEVLGASTLLPLDLLARFALSN